jgi:hypothetical protein
MVVSNVWTNVIWEKMIGDQIAELTDIEAYYSKGGSCLSPGDQIDFDF